MSDQKEASPTGNKNELTYDQAMKELESILESVENESISVDELEKRIKRARELIHFCRERLRSTEASVNTVLEDLEGELDDGDSGSEEAEEK